MSRASESKILIAKFYTDKIFSNVEINKYHFKNIEYLWGCYSDLYKNFSLNKASNLNSFYSSRFSLSIIKYFPVYLVAIVYSIISFFFLILTSAYKKRIAIWTGDFFDLKLNSDFRLGGLYKELFCNNISYIEFIRLGEINYSTFFSNLFLRRRLAIYYDSFDLIFYFLTPSIKIKLIDNYFSKSELIYINNSLNSFSKKRYQIYLFKFFFKSLGIKKYIIWETSHRQVFSRIAATDCNVYTLGFMHGFSFNSYMSYLFLDSYKGQYYFAPDVFFVWSKFWKEYFRNSKIYKEIQDCGPLRYNLYSNKFNKSSSNKLNILYICEPLIDVSEVIDYLFFLISNSDKYKLTFKLRSMNCKFYDQLIRNYPQFKDFDFTIEPFRQAINKFELVVGSHSTAVVESTIYNIPFLAIYTSKWGDYFELSSKFPFCIVNSINEFQFKLDGIIKIDSSLLKHFSINYFGTNNSINKIISLLK